MALFCSADADLDFRLSIEAWAYRREGVVIVCLAVALGHREIVEVWGLVMVLVLVLVLALVLVLEVLSQA